MGRLRMREPPKYHQKFLMLVGNHQLWRCPEFFETSSLPPPKHLPTPLPTVLSVAPTALHNVPPGVPCDVPIALFAVLPAAKRKFFSLKIKSHFLSNISNFLYFVIISQLGSIKTIKLLPTREKLQFPQNLQTPPTCFICCCSRCARSIAICSNLCVVSTSRASRNVASNAFRLALSPRSNDSTWRQPSYD